MEDCAIEDRVVRYWTIRSRDFGAVRKNELGSVMGRRLTAFKIDFCNGVIVAPLIYVAPPSDGALPLYTSTKNIHKKRPAGALLTKPKRLADPFHLCYPAKITGVR